jgi:hypothetical protein
MLKKIFRVTLLLIVCFVFYTETYAAGLTTGFSEVILEDLEVGKTYSTKEVAGLPLVVVNTGKEPVDLKLELLLPDTSELKEGYESIPDLAWIRLEKTDFKKIMPNEAATTDVLISIPEDKLHLGKKYQVFIWSHTTGGTIGIGLKSKLLLKIKGE